jgi:hypothetical protein
MKASLGGHKAVVQVLVEAGADKEARDTVSERIRGRRSHTHRWWKHHDCSPTLSVLHVRARVVLVFAFFE